MTKFRVHFEASAVIGIEIEVEATDEDDAQRIAQEKYDKGELMLTDLVDDLIQPDPNALSAYAETTGRPITYACCGIASDDSGFEIVDVFLPGCVP